MDEKDLEKIGNIILNILPDDPLEALSMLCTCIDHYGERLGFSNDETWKIVNEVRVKVFNELGEIEE